MCTLSNSDGGRPGCVVGQIPQDFAVRGGHTTLEITWRVIVGWVVTSLKAQAHGVHCDAALGKAAAADPYHRVDMEAKMRDFSLFGTSLGTGDVPLPMVNESICLGPAWQ